MPLVQVQGGDFGQERYLARAERALPSAKSIYGEISVVSNYKGWCYGISTTFIKNCNEAFSAESADSVLEYQRFLIQQVRKLKENSSRANWIKLTTTEVEALANQTLYHSTGDFMEVDHARNVWEFWDHAPDAIRTNSNATWNGNSLQVNIVSSVGHAVVVDLTMQNWGVGFIFDPNCGLLTNQDVAMAPDIVTGQDLIADLIGEHYQTWQVHNNLLPTIKNAACEAIDRFYPTLVTDPNMLSIKNDIRNRPNENISTDGSRMNNDNGCLTFKGEAPIAHASIPYEIRLLANPRRVLSGGVSAQVTRMTQERMRGF